MFRAIEPKKLLKLLTTPIALVKNSLLLLTGFIKTNDHRPTDHLPLTHQFSDHLPTDPPTAYHELTLKQRPDSKHVIYSKVLVNFHNHLFPE